jgi:hypothetical protein
MQTAGKPRRRRARTLGALALLPLCAGAHAESFVTQDGWQVSLDTNVAAGFSLRASPVDYRFVGIANGGTERTPNGDNGDLNFRDTALTSAPFSVTEELDIKRDNYGAFIRANAFYDPVYDGITPDFMKFPRATVRDLGFDVRLLDAYVYTDTQIGGHAVSFRLGNQVINWGESIFIQGGVNSATPFDQNALQRAGAELKEAVLPIPAFDVRATITHDLSVEAFYEFLWVRTRFPPDGSFFSDLDSVSDGGYYAVEDRSFPDSPSNIDKINLATNDPYGPVLLRAVDHHPPNQGEFGLALRYSAPSLNDTEFGVYFETYHDRTPLAGYTTGTRAAAISNDHLLLSAPGATYNSTVRYYADYPSDIHLIGGSFSASLPGGVGLQGEISDRLNQPLLLATPDSVLELEAPFLCQLGGYLAGLGLGVLGAPANAACAQAHADPVTAASGGLPAFDQNFPQYKRAQVTQMQISATKLIPPISRLGIANLTAIGELGADMLPNFPRDSGIYDSPHATDTSSAFAKIATLNGTLQNKGKVTQFATGGVAALVAEMPNVLPWGLDFEPFLAVFAGFSGRDAEGEGYLQQGQDSFTAGADFVYLQRVRLNVQYTNHFSIGTSQYYDLDDRDYVSISLSYNF